MTSRAPVFASLLMLLSACCFTSSASAQFVDEPERGFSDEEGAPADRGGRGERGERGGRPGREEGGEGGFRGRGPRPNPLFEALDVDGDGMITARELRQAVRNLKELDADGDGSISLEEASPRGGFGGGPGGFGDPEAMIDRTMERNDANGDGQLTQDEIPEFMARMLTGADTNGDGAISRDELRQGMQNFRGPGGFGGGPGGFGGGRGFGGGGDPDTMTRQLIGQADRNGDGTISEDEMNPQMRGMLQGADADGNGVLDAREIRVYMETARQRMQQFRGRQFGEDGGDRQRRPQRDEE